MPTCDTGDHLHPGRAARPSRGPLRVVAGAVGLALATGLCLGACTGATPSGNASAVTKAKSGLEAAVAAMQRASSFSFTGAVGPQRAPVHLSGQFTAPDREHLVVSAGNGTTTELVFAGKQAYVKTTAGTWVNKLSNGSAPADPRQLFHALDAASSVTMRDTDGSTTYSFLLPATAASALGGTQAASSSSHVQGTARVVHGRLADLSLRWGAGATLLEADVSYTMVDTTPPVVTPLVS